MPPRTVPGVAVPGSTVPVDRVATRLWVTPCQIAGAVSIKGERSKPVALAPCFYPMATAAKPARPRTLAQLTAHPWVEEVSDERGMGQGIWIYLKPGHQWDGCHTIHEFTVKECCRAFGYVAADPTDELKATPAPAAPAPRPVLPGEATPPPAPSHGEAAPTLPQLRADAAAGRPVSLSAVARAAQSEMAARRAARRAAHTGG